jgi:ribonuclease E
MGVSLWHKIFGLPEQQAERIAEISSSEIEESVEFVEREEFREERLRDESRGRRGRVVDDTGGDFHQDNEPWDAESESSRSSAGSESEEGRSEGTESGDEPRRRRRRRGRGRGRGRGRDGDAGGEERSAEQGEGRSDEAREPREPREQREPRGRGRGRSGGSGRSRREDTRRSAPKDDFDDDGLEEIVLDDPDDEAVDSRMSDEGGDDFLDDGERTMSPGHKSIPSWDEAIGMIVDTNLATRTDRRRSSGPPSRGNGAQRGGRPRGGRRRKKPS